MEKVITLKEICWSLNVFVQRFWKGGYCHTINNTFAQPAGLSLDDALIKEGPESPYVNLIAVRSGDEEREEIRQLVDAYQRDEVIEKAEELFKGAAVPGWIEE